MVDIIGVKFKDAGKVYYFDPDGVCYTEGSSVIVETARGLELGLVAIGNSKIDENKIVSPLRKAIRPASKEDIAQAEANRDREKEALAICEQRIVQHKLDMKLIDAEITFDGSKILFFFTSDGRVDFRELVKDLASVFRTRIELRQIGVRDEAKLLGGLGICGREFCCSSFLDEFHPVSIKMAKEQYLSLNPVKISGTCGRLMCCLKYEQEAYEDLSKNSLYLNAYVKTPDGNGVVTEVMLLKGQVKVRLDRIPESPPKTYEKTDVKLLKYIQTNTEQSVKTEDELKKLED